MDPSTSAHIVMITRQIGKILRGKATPFQLISASILAGMIGFIPDLTTAPGLFLFWLFLLVILNANLLIAAVVGSLAKLLSLLLMPVSFSVGQLLLDGPTESLFKTLVNAPVIAFFGLDYYAVTGGQVIALILGVIIGFILIRLVTVFRQKMAEREKDPDKVHHWTKHRWFKIALFFFVGGNKGEKTYDELLAKRVGNPIRLLGLVLVVVTICFLSITALFFQGPLVTSAIRSGLEEANGATVDLGSADLNLKKGRLVLTDLALADPNALETDLFRTALIEADISTANLLRKRMVLDQLTIHNASNGESRKIPGQLTRPLPKDQKSDSENGEESIDDILENAKVWKERLSQLRHWLETLSQSDEEDKSDGSSGPSYQEQLEERIRLLGYAKVRAKHLITKTPTALIKSLTAAGITSTRLEGETFTLDGKNISTHPRLNSEAPEISILSDSGILAASLRFGFSPQQSDNHIQLTYKNQSLDALAQQLKKDGKSLPFKGGTVDIFIDGTLSSTDSNLPVTLTLHNTTFSLGGRDTKIAELAIPVTIHGPIDNPSIKVDSSQFKNLFLSAGKAELSNRLSDELQKQLGGESKEGQDGKDAVSNLLGGFLKKKAPEEPKKE
ncbi:MAG: hypothetical protein JKY51_11970 [Opitutaceae bacterium]|nr:hypothetical protein [Opitutaceae bacterium]